MTKDEKLAKYVEISGYTANVDQMIGLIVDSMLSVFADDGPAFKHALELVRETFLARRSQIITVCSSIFEEAYTEEDLDALIAFYDSSVGRKMVSQASALMSRCAEAGEAWGQKVFDEIRPQIEAMARGAS